MICSYLQLRWLISSALGVAVIASGILAANAQVPNSSPSSETPLVPTVVVPSPPPTQEELGDALMHHQRYQAAIEAYKNAPAKSADLWNKLGIAYQMLYNYQDAVRCYQTSVKLDPRNAHVYNNLGTIYDALKQYKPAERMYRKALKYEPASALVLKNLGTNLLAQHNYKKGWEVYQAALDIDPQIFERPTNLRVDNPGSVQDRGAMNFYMAKGCVRSGDFDRAIDYLRNAVNQGFISAKKIAADSEFASLRGMPAFDQLIAEQQNQ
jgi:tetratricopeptide (TPR) repeat protein